MSNQKNPLYFFKIETLRLQCETFKNSFKGLNANFIDSNRLRDVR